MGESYPISVCSPPKLPIGWIMAVIWVDYGRVGVLLGGCWVAVGWILLGDGVGVLQKMITFASLPVVRRACFVRYSLVPTTGPELKTDEL